MIASAQRDVSDPDNPTLASPEQTLPGWYVTVSLPDLNETLRDLPDNACRSIGDSTLGANIYTAPDLDLGLQKMAIIEPVPAGANYIFDGNQRESCGAANQRIMGGAKWTSR